MAIIISLLIIMSRAGAGGGWELLARAKDSVGTAIYNFLRLRNDDLYRASNGHFRRHQSRLYHSIKCKISPFSEYYSPFLCVNSRHFMLHSLSRIFIYISRHQSTPESTGPTSSLPSLLPLCLFSSYHSPPSPRTREGEHSCKRRRETSLGV